MHSVLVVAGFIFMIGLPCYLAMRSLGSEHEQA